MSLLLVASPGEVPDARRAAAEGRGLVAGSAHVRTLLADLDGVLSGRVVAGGDLVGPAGAAAIVGRVGDVAGALETRIGEAGVPDALRAILMAKAVQALFVWEGMRAAERAAGQEILRADGVPARRRPPDRLVTRGTAAREVPPGEVPAARRPYELDLRSTSGLKMAAAPERLRLRPRSVDKPDWVARIESRARLLTGGAGPHTWKHVVPRLPGGGLAVRLDDLLEPEGVEVLAGTLGETEATFRAFRSAGRRLLQRLGRPERAIFNNVGNPGLAGIAAALAEAGVPGEMASHGCLVAYGAGPRHLAARVLGQAVYNSFPGLSRLMPRSPLQARHLPAGAEVVREVRVRPAEPRGAGPFRVYHAPNFQPWESCPHGLSIDCFQTVRAVEALAAAVRRSAGVALDLRIKTTAKDMAKRERLKSPRGLMPGDVAHVIDAGAGVRDASLGSHAGYLAAADLVVTEGLTAVMFEALEHRTPVLLLSDGGILPSLPAVGAADLLAGAPRGAVYAATAADDLGAVLGAIRARHEGRPLTDAELADYVWV